MKKNAVIHHTPNALSGLRILLTVPVCVLIRHHAWSSAFLVFCLGALTDVADGWVARKWNASSSLGLILDPVADKIFLLGLFGSLWATDLFPGWVFALLCAKESLFLAAGLALVSRHKRVIPANIWGKFFTFSQFILIVFIFLNIFCPKYRTFFPFFGQGIFAIFVLSFFGTILSYGTQWRTWLR